MNCPNCGAQNPDNAVQCTNCGQPIAQAQQPPVYQQPFAQPYGQTANTTGMLVWSIINIFLCTILGIIATVMTVGAKSAATQPEFESKMKTARILNIIGTIVGALTIIGYIIFWVIVAGAAATVYYW